MAKVSEYTEHTAPQPNDVMLIVDTTAGETKKIKFSNVGGTSSVTADDASAIIAGQVFG